ncbi:MAG: hypothetical protein JJ979_19490, partial [Roseibium sp.]|nr:hypothetical protein [Roseibium sp.]
MATYDQKTLKTFIGRRHPDYARKVAHWDFLEKTYEGGREWFNDNVFRYLKEGDKEFADRLERAYRFNHTREAVDLIQKYLFKAKINRNKEDAPEAVKAFWKESTEGGLDIFQFMQSVSAMTSKFGRIWVFTDTNVPDNALSVAEAKKEGARVYAYAMRPQDVLDIGFTDRGIAKWILVREFIRDDDDPLGCSGDIRERFRLWTKDQWYLFREVEAGKRGTVVRLEQQGANELGRLPCFPV